jgi:predicted esterase
VNEHHLEVRRTARYWTLGDPATAEEVWIVLHGYRQLARRFLRRFGSIDDGRRLIVAPEALSRFYISPEQGRHGATSVVGAAWMTREDRQAEIRDYVGYLDRLVATVGSNVSVPVRGETATAGSTRLTVLGFSQGVATATRWVTHGSVRPGRLVLWGDLTPPDLDLAGAGEALADVDVVLVRGSEDPALSPRLVDEEVARLAEANIAYSTVDYDGGHDIDADTLLKIASTGIP